MNQNYTEIFNQLWMHSENEVVEFKKAENGFDIDDLGKYFSALSNEANLRGLDFAWMVFGVWDKTHQIVGTHFKESEQSLNALKQDMSQHTTDNLIFRDIVAIEVEGKRVLLFKIPASPRNIVMRWKGIAYARDGESIKPMNQAKQDEIRHQSPDPDWSAEPIPSATIADLDELAIATARIMYKKVHASKIPAAEVDGWTTEEFLSHSGVMIDGQLTRAAILLLGKPITSTMLRPAVAQITWTLQDEEGTVLDYEHFGVPFILTVDKVLAKVRNMTMREMPGGTLFPDTMKQYDDYSIREALHNCIAHQDYTLEQRISFVEAPGKLYYGNGGTFIPITLERALQHKGPQRHYRNACLCEGMVNFNMIDTVGRGIRKIFMEQRNRLFPMPDYDIDNEGKSVGVTIYGKAIDDRYTQALRNHTDLTLMECVWLDAVQKGHPNTDMVYKNLKERGLIEGRKPNYTISLQVAKMTKQLGRYTKAKGLTAEKLQAMIIQLATDAGESGFKRTDAFEALDNVLPSGKTRQQKIRIIGQLLTNLATKDEIYCKGKFWFRNVKK